jgi:putative intracellular protease/amidase
MVIAAAICAGTAVSARAQAEGGLYIAGEGFTFQQAAQRAMKNNPRGQRFFLLSLPPETRALMTNATRQLAAVRDRVVAANGMLYVCQRDIDNGKIDAGNLVPGVLAVRGWPPAGADSLPHGARYFEGEDPSKLPASNNALRRLRSTCAA